MRIQDAFAASDRRRNRRRMWRLSGLALLLLAMLGALWVFAVWAVHGRDVERAMELAI